VSGTFRNIAGTITALDTANHSITVNDLIAKGPVVVRISSDSQIKKLPAEMAQRIAARLKGAAGTNGDHNGAGVQNASAQNPPLPGGETRRGADSSGLRPGATNGNGPPDLQRMLSRLPNSMLADMQKGEAVMIVSTQGGDSGAVTAITLLAGVEPILTAAPSQTASSLLSPWSLTASASEADAAP
jgi:hypothetical protein